MVEEYDGDCMTNVKIKKLPCKTERAIKFEVRGADANFLNTLRRTMLARVKTMAISKVDMVSNMSALYDETVSHRLGLIPITFNSKNYGAKEDCKCKGNGCTNCEVKFVLHKTGPCSVYSSDLKSTDKEVRPLNDKILIVKLLEGQELNLEATAELGTGITHTRWQPAIMGYDEKNTREGNAYVVTLESVSGLDPKEIMLSTLEALDNRLGQLKDALKS